MVFTLERAPEADPAEPGFFLQHHGRYCHTEEYVRRILSEAGLSVRNLTSGVLRMELGQPVQGMVAVGGKGQPSPS